MRESFERIEDGCSVQIEVEPNAYAYSQKYKWLLSVFVKFDPVHAAEDKIEEFLDTKESIITLLEHNDLSKYAGSRMIDGWSELYFYAKDPKSLTNKVQKFLTSLQYPYETNVVKDTKWDFYNNNLYPTELEWHYIRSEQIIQMLEEEGDELLVPRSVEHYVYFDTPSQKEKFIKLLPYNGFEYKDEIDLEDIDNGIALEKVHSLDKETVTLHVKDIYDKVTKEHGYYEGWSTVLADEANN